MRRDNVSLCAFLQGLDGGGSPRDLGATTYGSIGDTISVHLIDFTKIAW